MFNMYKNITKLCDVKKIEILYEDEYTIELITRLYEMNLYSELLLYTTNADLRELTVKRVEEKEKYYKNNSIEIKTKLSFVETIKTEDVDLLFFDTKIYPKDIATAQFQVKYLFGHIWCDTLPYFDIWENNKKTCDYIYIQRINQAGKAEILEWKKENATDNEEQIELSVVFPVYKVADYLPKCIETVTAWKAPYVEFLFVNDGSPDNSVEIIQQYQQNDSRIKIIHKENGGCASARKLGLEQAKGKYVGFVDPDDYVEVEMFKKLYSRAIIGSYQICYSGYNFYYETTKTFEKAEEIIGWPYSEGTTDINQIRDLLINSRVAIWRAIYRKDFLDEKKISFNTSLKRFDDLPFKVETLLYAKSVASVPEHLYYYRLNRPGQDVACDDERLYVHFDIFAYLDEIVQKINDQKLIDYLQIIKVQTHAWGLGLIQNKYAFEYARRAKKDFQKNCSMKRTLFLIKQYLGKDQLDAYMSIMTLRPSAFKRHNVKLKRSEMKNQSKMDSTLKKLDNLL